VLEFETTIRLEHTPENAPDFRIEEYAREHPFAYDDNELPDLDPYIRRHYPADAAVPQWLSKFVPPGVSRPTGQLLMTLNEAIAEGFSYQRRTMRGTQTPEETIGLQRGTCRDFALLMMECARSLGFAARFIAGGSEAAQHTHGVRSTSQAPVGSNSIQPTASLEIGAY
jgi:transglutaminase-like putative cysteine protease